MTADQVGEYFDDRSWLFQLNGFNLHIGYFDDKDPSIDPKERHTDILIDEVCLGRGQHLLDVGCGFGRPAIRFVQRTEAEVVGINVSEEQIRTANRLAAEAGVGDRARFEVADANRLPYPDGSFDAVWAVETLMYLPNRLTALQEIFRVLAPGGIFVLSDYTERIELTTEQRAALAKGFTVDSLPTSEQYDELLATAGFATVRSEDATAHLHRSAARIPDVLADNYDLIVEKGGKQFAEEFKAMLSQVAVLERDYMGYVIKVLRKELLASGTVAADTVKTTTTVPYLARTIVDGAWVPIEGHQRSYESAAPASVRAGQLFVVTVDPAPSTTNPSYIKIMKDILLAFKLPDNANLVEYKLSGGSGLGDAMPSVKVVGKQLLVTAPGPIAGGTTFNMPAVTLVLRAPHSGTVTTAPGGTSFEKPGFAFMRQVVGEDTWGPLQAYPDPAQPVVFTTTTVKTTAD